MSEGSTSTAANCLPLTAVFVVLTQGVVTPIGAVVTAATGVKKRSRGQGLFLVSVKRSRTIFKLGNAVKMVAFLWPLTSGTVNS